MATATAERVAIPVRGSMTTLLRKIALTDLAVIVWAVAGAQVMRFSGGSSAVTLDMRGDRIDVGYTAVSVLIVLLWMLLLRMQDGYDGRLVGFGPQEYKAVFTASLQLVAVVGLTSFLLNLQLSRGYVVFAFPVGTVGLLLSRLLWRRWLVLHRERSGRFSSSVLVVGDAQHLTGLIDQLHSVPAAGYRVVGACCSDNGADTLGDVPIWGSESVAAELAAEHGVDTIACTASWRLGARGLRELGWALEESGIQLVVVPGLTEVAGPRVLTRPLAGLPLLLVEAPVFRGPRLVAKTVLDRVTALVSLAVLWPVFIVIAVLIKRDDGGPVFFTQERAGLDGRTFRMLKFRSMVVGAEDLRVGLEAQNRSDGPLFKLADDPRVTTFGRFLRRYSLDELPQFVNVLWGDMSLVGPRPPLLSEVQAYAEHVHRRLLVRPGITGLWQINGRADLSWDESVRFDLYYVENWSLITDFIILWKTASAVIARVGAY